MHAKMGAHRGPAHGVYILSPSRGRLYGSDERYVLVGRFALLDALLGCISG